jgi:hypothetical protein
MKVIEKINAEIDFIEQLQPNGGRQSPEATKKFLNEIRVDIVRSNQRVITTLEWIIKYFDWQNQQSELEQGDSPELTEAKNLLAELKNE